ncbi:MULTISPECIES: molybdenum cofactor guanylyltransferase MobA [Salinicola]|uniref:Molybdenum cofactor guanylyltransferase n=1 Tax=Salinicola socius TaxID=404433 RepID=A0A1Q8SRX2_9GAMM|nr:MULTISPECIES: molybdenum cofactor guanylyltransferase MobA [Salinicola]OLO04177.1 molybdenum cofactor guanylyltransferase [Salinicola socius]
MIDRSDVTGVLLAGGRGQRMGGVDKGWVSLDGVPLVQQALQRLAPQVGGIVISANRHIDRYRRLGYPVVVDSLPDYPGPLAGALGALHHVATSWILLAPVDMPWLPADLLSRLSNDLGESDIAVAHDGERLQPLVALIRSSLVEDLAQWLDAGGGKVVGWYARHRWCQVDFSDRSAQFVNLNTPEACERAERHRPGSIISRQEAPAQDRSAGRGGENLDE